ncbi:MAG: ribosome biogenesis GTPase Der [Pseudobdellovibrionaceae bacterium]
MSWNDVSGPESVMKVAIIGRPNVGKSTLFNILTGTRKAVVKNQPGVTRDIMIHPCEIWGKHFDLIDTGGITEAHDTFSVLIREQVLSFLETVDLLLVVMDGRAGLVPEDREILKIAQISKKPFLVILNKIDRGHDEETLKSDFYELGVDLVATSFETRRGVSDILEWVHKVLPEKTQEVHPGMKIAIVGKPNVGKSSLVNALLGSPRMIVSDIAGTTIDAVDTPFQFNGNQYTLVDTAGLRRSSSRDEDLEIISAFKSQEAIRRANLILLVVDSTQGPSVQDAKIMQAILEDHKAVILVANKSDIGKVEIPEFKKTFKEQIERVFHFFNDVQVVFTSAKTGHGLDDLLEKIEWMATRMTTRISTSELNDFFFDTIRKAPAPVWGNNNVKFYYLTQTFQQPPAFIAFANHPDGVDNSYRRFLIKNMKDQFDLAGIPIRIFVMKSKKSNE